MVSYPCNNETGPKLGYCKNVEVAEIGAAEGSKREMKNLKVPARSNTSAQTTLFILILAEAEVPLSISSEERAHFTI